MPENLALPVMSESGTEESRGTDRGGATFVDASMVGGESISEALEILELASFNMLRFLEESRKYPRFKAYPAMAVESAVTAWHYGKVVLGYGPGPVANQKE